MVLHLKAAKKTDIGLQREQNEDACFARTVEQDSTTAGLFIVADGMGGYQAGEVASRIAVDTISEMLEPMLGPSSNQPTIRLKHKRKRGQTADANQAEAETEAEQEETASEGTATQQLQESLYLDHYGSKLRAAIEESNRAIIQYGQEHPETSGLGSTVTAALVVGNVAYIANVGDSRTYLLRNGKLTRITRDHSLVERLVQAGQIDAEDVYDHPHRNLVYRSLGAGKSDVDVDIFTEQLEENDALLLCCDGLWEMVHDPQMEQILNEVDDPDEATEILIQRANENGGEDNITAVLVRCTEG